MARDKVKKKRGKVVFQEEKTKIRNREGDKRERAREDNSFASRLAAVVSLT